MRKRVVVTGFGAISPLGNDWESVSAKLKSCTNAVQVMQEWSDIKGLHTRLGCPAAPFELDPVKYNRKSTRSMGRVGLLGVRATEVALANAGLLDNQAFLSSGDLGIAYGSSAGTPSAVADIASLILKRSTSDMNANTYVRMMSHTAAVNIGVFFKIKGRIITTSSACTSSSQAIGYAYESILAGRAKAMIAGGSEELDASDAAIFDTLFATSTNYNDHPELSPRPFDAKRDGLVIGEGGCTLILEELEFAKARGAKIYAEVLGFGTNSDGTHITSPQSDQMAQAMRLALADAELSAEDIGYINAHATSTRIGDSREAEAIAQVFGDVKVPVTSTKSQTGHEMWMAGASEIIYSMLMMKSGFIAGNINFENPDEDSAKINVLPETKEAHFDMFLSNSFGFGGTNSTLIVKNML